jgi:hypothetical protein
MFQVFLNYEITKLPNYQISGKAGAAFTVF